MASVRTLWGSLCAAIALAGCGSSPAKAQTWETVTQQGGYKIARVSLNGAATGIGLTCERSVPIIAINLARTPRRNPALLTLKAGTGSTALPIVRNGATNVWVAAVKELRLLDAMASGQRVGLAVDGADYGTASLVGADAAMRTALSGCWRMDMATGGISTTRVPGKSTAIGRVTASGGEAVPGEGRTIFQNASLPEVLRRDLGDFESTCNFTYDQDYNFEKPARRGPALAALGAIVKADFNGDGIEDYLLNSAKLKCTRPLPGESGGTTVLTSGYNLSGVLMIYTSLPDGGIVPSLDVPVDSFTIIAGKKAALRIHQDAVTEGIEDDLQPEINETLTMVSATQWGRSTVAMPDWRLGSLAAFPKALRDQFAQWDSECAAVGRRFRVPDDGEGYGMGNALTYLDTEYDKSGNVLLRTIPVDLNGDGKRDYVIDTDMLTCGVFGAPLSPRPPYLCGQDCTLIAFISRPDGSYLADRVKGSITFMGNGDPAHITRIGRKHGIEMPCNFVVTWAGTTQQRTPKRCSYD